MAKTPFIDLKSEDILSAHISGIQHAIGKLEQILNMKTLVKTGYTLDPVIDQQDSTLHRFIYEGKTRNWLSVPAPVIYRNGAIVLEDEYVIQPAYGVIVFKAQQGAEHSITADFTHVDGVSQVITDLNTSVSANTTGVSGLKTRMTTAEGNITGQGTRLTTLETNGVPIGVQGYSSGGGTFEADGSFLVPNADEWRWNSPNLTPLTVPNVAVAPGTIDAFPIYLKERTIIDKVRVNVTTQQLPGSRCMIGFYSNANGLPHKRIDYTNAFIDVVGTHDVTFRMSDLTLEAGVYWIARYSEGGNQYTAIDDTEVTSVIFPVGFPVTAGTSSGAALYPAGVRATHSSPTVMPADFPILGSLKRPAYVCPQYHIKKTY